MFTQEYYYYLYFIVNIYFVLLIISSLTQKLMINKFTVDFLSEIKNFRLSLYSYFKSRSCRFKFTIIFPSIFNIYFMIF